MVERHSAHTQLPDRCSALEDSLHCRCRVSSINGVAVGADQFKRRRQCYGQEVAMEIFMGSGGRALHYCNNLIIIAIILNNNACFQLVAHYLDGDGAEDLFF